MKKLLIPILLALFTACERADLTDDGNVTISFIPTTADITRGEIIIGDYFSKLNIQLFTADGEKVFSTVKTQTSTDPNFGTLNVDLEPGTYTVVAVGHSSTKSASIKSAELVQFTATDGQKLTDTFCHCGKVIVDEESGFHELRMNRVTAMIRFVLIDEDIPEDFDHLRIDYSGGSANFSPTTMEGCTKSNQSELRLPATEYQVFTFPYLSSEGNLKVTLNALDANGNILKHLMLTDVPITRNRITTYTGTLFADGGGTISQTAFGITVNADWDGEDFYTF